MKKYVLLVLFLIIYSFYSIAHSSESKYDYISVKEKIEYVKKGKYFKIKIDSFVKNKSRDELVQISERLSVIINNYSDNASVIKDEVLTILYYFDYKINNQINLYRKDSDSENKIYVGETSEINNYTKEPLYKGFSSDYNEYPKTVLAGEESFIFNGGFIARVEEIEIHELKVLLYSDDLSKFKYSFREINLYIEGLKVSTAKPSNFYLNGLNTGELLFDNIDGLIIPKQQVEFRISIIPETIGYEKNGVIQDEIIIKEMEVTKAKGLISGEYTKNFSLTQGEESFHISPLILSIEGTKNLTRDGYVEFKITAESGRNTQTSSNKDIIANIESIKFLFREFNGSSIYKLYSSDNSSEYIIGIKNGQYIEFDMNSFKNSSVVSGSYEKYRVSIEAKSGVIFSLDLLKNGINYSVNGYIKEYNINGDKDIYFGSIKY